MKAKFLALAALVLGMASCQQDVELDNPVVGGEVDFQLKVDAKELATRGLDNDNQNGCDSAYGAIDYLQATVDEFRVDWNDVDLRYTLEVFDANVDYTGEVYPVKDRQVIIVDKYEPVAFDLRLVPNRDYRFVVFADFVANGEYAKEMNPSFEYQRDLGLHHTIGYDLREITIKNDGINDECADAYFATKDIKITNSAAQNIILKRPYGKVRVIATDLDQLNINVDPADVTVTYTAKHPQEFNAVTGDIDDYTEEEYTFPSEYAASVSKATLKDHYYTIGYDADKVTNANGLERHSHMTLFTDYILSTNEGQQTIHFTMTVNDKSGKEIKTTHFNTDIPVERNHLTTIVGNVLTTATEINVTIDDNFAQPELRVDIWDGKSMTEPETTEGENGEAQYVVDSASDLAWLADFVNNPITRATPQSVNFVLAADIDLDNQPWTPIGYNSNDEAGGENYFTGVFDGNGHTIYNVNVDVKDQGGVGFFGAIHNATIKNLTLCNVFVKAVESENDPTNTSGAEGKVNYIAGGHIGAVAGYDAKSGTIVFENVHVKGLIKIEGETRAAQGQRVGGIIGGRSSSKYTFKNVSVEGVEGSYIKGYCSTAGVIGHNQEVATFENVKTDIDVYAVTFGAGGIAGIARQGSTFTNCSSAGDITLDASKTQLSSYSANYPYRVGGIAGCWSESKNAVLTLANCSYTGKLTSIDKDGKKVSAFDYAGFVGRGYTLKNCAGSTVDVNGAKYVQAYDDVYGLYIVDGVYQIGTAASLKSFAAKVNAGETFEDKSVVLTADIDLMGEEWTPIGSAYKDHGFMGNFDGNGKTIKNLSMTKLTRDSDGYVYAGLFGVTEGTAEKHNSIKNLTIENVTIQTDGHIVAAAIAYPYYTDLENITVKGDVAIKGGDYTSGVLAYTRRCVNAKDIAIKANQGSVIEGNSTVGGVISDIQMNGGLTANYSNFEATGLTIKASKCVGGISGIICNQTLNGATVKNVTIVSDDVRKGAISGSFDGVSVINNAVVENVDGADNFVGALYEGTVSTKSSVTINGQVYTYNNGWLVDGYQVIANGLLKKDNVYKVINANGLVALSGITIKGGEVVTLGADIDLNGVVFNGLNAFNPENNNTFDGQGFTVSNWTNNSGASDMGFIKNWVGPIMNVKFDNCHLKTAGRSAIVAAKVYGNIEKIEVKNCSIEDSYWACGIIAGLYNSGSISDCSVTDSSVKSNGGTAGIVGVINETAGERNLTNCSVTNTTIHNTGVYGAVYSGGGLVGMFNTDNSTYNFTNCTVSNNTLKGEHIFEKYPANDSIVE